MTEGMQRQRNHSRIPSTKPSEDPHWAAIKLPSDSKRVWDNKVGRNKPLNMSARCWWGGPAERPSNEAKILNMTRQADADSGTILVGELPNRPNPGEDVIPHTDYSCNYGFIQGYSSGTYLSNIPIPDQETLFNEGEQVEINYPSLGPATLDENVYYVAGSNQIPPFNGVQTVSSYIDETGFDFEEHQAATANPENPFKHFPEGGFSGDEQLDVRDPTAICLGPNGPC